MNKWYLREWGPFRAFLFFFFLTLILSFIKFQNLVHQKTLEIVKSQIAKTLAIHTSGK